MSMGRGDSTHEGWARLKPRLPKSGECGGRRAGHRRVITTAGHQRNLAPPAHWGAMVGSTCAFREKTHAPAAPPRRRTRTLPGRPDVQDSPRRRTINALKTFRAVATRFDKRGYIFHGT